MAIFDASGRFVLRNRAVRERMGITDEEALSIVHGGRPVRLLRRDGSLLPWEEWVLVRALRGETVTGAEQIVVCPDGSHRHVLVSASALTDAEGKVEMAILVFSDVTTLLPWRIPGRTSCATSPTICVSP